MAGAYQNANKLGDLLAQLPLNTNQEQWNSIEVTAQSLANDLRVRDGTLYILLWRRTQVHGRHSVPVERQTAIGKTFLPQTLTSLLKGALGAVSIPPDGKKSAVFEILRVGANLCMDHGGLPSLTHWRSY